MGRDPTGARIEDTGGSTKSCSLKTSRTGGLTTERNTVVTERKDMESRSKTPIEPEILLAVLNRPTGRQADLVGCLKPSERRDASVERATKGSDGKARGDGG